MEKLRSKYGIFTMRFFIVLFLLILYWLFINGDSSIAKQLHDRFDNFEYFLGYLFTTSAVIIGVVEQYHLHNKVKKDSLVQFVYPLYPRWEIVKCYLLIVLHVLFWISMLNDLPFIIRISFLIQISFIPQFFSNTIYCAPTYFVHREKKYYYENISEYKKGEYNTFDIVLDGKKEIIHFDYDNERKVLIKALERSG